MIYLKTDRETFISGSYGKEFFNIKYDDSVFENLRSVEDAMNKQLEAKKPNMLEINTLLEACADIVKIDDVATMVTGVKYLMYDPKLECYCITVTEGDVTYIESLTSKATDYCKSIMGLGLSIQPVVNCFMRLMTSQFYTPTRLNNLVTRLKSVFTDYEEVSKLTDEGLSHSVAERRCTYPDVQLTPAGMLSLFKVVEEITTEYTKDENGQTVLVDKYKDVATVDKITGKEIVSSTYPTNLEDRLFKPAIYSGGIDFYCGKDLGYIYKVGEVHSIPKWSDMDMDSNTMHKGVGLYCGSLAYVKAYKGSKDEVMRCLVCPSNIGKFTDAGKGEITCKELFIFDSVTIDNSVVKGTYLHNNYANKVIEDVAKSFVERKKFNELKKKMNCLID